MGRLKVRVVQDFVDFVELACGWVVNCELGLEGCGVSSPSSRSGSVLWG